MREIKTRIDVPRALYASNSREISCLCFATHYDSLWLSPMKQKHLESALSRIQPRFEEPKLALEQYPTSAHIAAAMLHMIENMYGDVEGKVVCDLGVGTGMLASAATLMGSSYTFGVDIDPDALRQAQANFEHLEINVDLIRCAIGEERSEETASGLPVVCVDGVGASTTRRVPPCDVVVMNPPFGTRRRGIDMAFLKCALGIARDAVYSLHKTSTRKHIMKAAKAMGATVEIIAELRFDVPKMYKMHREKSKDILVDFIRFVPNRAATK